MKSNLIAICVLLLASPLAAFAGSAPTSGDYVYTDGQVGEQLHFNGDKLAFGTEGSVNYMEGVVTNLGVKANNPIQPTLKQQTYQVKFPNRDKTHPEIKWVFCTVTFSGILTGGEVVMNLIGGDAGCPLTTGVLAKTEPFTGEIGDKVSDQERSDELTTGTESEEDGATPSPWKVIEVGR